MTETTYRIGKRFRSASPVSLLLLASLLLLPAELCSQDGEAVAAAEPAEYIGSEMCEACHSEVFEAFQSNAHVSVETDAKRGWEGRSCESCHGPGSKHMESMEAVDILNPVKLEPMRADEGCLECHLNTPTQVGRINGSHARNQVACIACHSVHTTDESPLRPRPRTKINQECSECHTDAWASFQRPYGHKLPQGVMSCLDCHNPHGSFPPRNMRTVSANEPGCIRCHGNLRGPFTFEHAPVEFEGCAACHEPHGSANPRLLTRHEVSNLCLECHSNLYRVDGSTQSGALGGIPTGFHDLRNPRFRNCTACHVKIHGSHINRDFLR